MPSRKGSTNRGQNKLVGNFYRIRYEFMGKVILIQGFIGDANWSWWITSEHAQSFTFELKPYDGDLMTVRREKRAKGSFWYGYRKFHGKLFKRYVGKDVTLDKLRAAFTAIDEKIDNDDDV